MDADIVIMACWVEISDQKRQRQKDTMKGFNDTVETGHHDLLGGVVG